MARFRRPGTLCKLFFAATVFRIASSLVCDTTEASPGFGSRIADLLSVCAYARIKGQDALHELSHVVNITCSTSGGGCRANDLFVMPPGCAFKPSGEGVVGAGSNCSEEINLASRNLCNANFAPPDILDLLAQSGHDINQTIVDDVVRRVFLELGIAPSLAIGDLSELGQTSCVHVRQNSAAYSNHSWRILRQRALIYSSFLIGRNETTFYVFGDPEQGPEVRTMEQDLIKLGGYILDRSPEAASRDLLSNSERTAIDFFRLSRCKRILQMSRHSPFSLAAAAVGAAELVHFSDERNWLLDRWSSVVRLMYV